MGSVLTLKYFWLVASSSSGRCGKSTYTEYFSDDNKAKDYAKLTNGKVSKVGLYEDENKNHYIISSFHKVIVDYKSIRERALAKLTQEEKESLGL